MPLDSNHQLYSELLNISDRLVFILAKHLNKLATNQVTAHIDTRLIDTPIHSKSSYTTFWWSQKSESPVKNFRWPWKWLQGRNFHPDLTHPPKQKKK